MNVGKWFRCKVLSLTAMLVLGIIIPVMAEQAQDTLSLKEIVDTAVKNNPAVIESQKRWEEKEARIPLAKAWTNPQFGIMKDDIPKSSLNPFDAMMTEYTFTQDIMNPSKLKAMGKMAGSDAAMTKANYQDKQMEAYAAAKTAYYDLLYADKALEIGKENQQLMGQLVQIAQVNYSTGMVPLQDTLRAQTEFSKMTTDLLSMTSMAAVAKAKVNTVIGRKADTPFTVKEEFSAPPPDFDLTTLQTEAQAEKPAVVGMEQQVEMAKNGVELAKKQQLPDYQFSIGYKDRKQTMMSATPDTWKMEVMVMLPIWQGKNKAEIKSAAASLEAAQASLATMQSMTELDLQMALTEAQSAWRQIDLYKNTVIPQAEQTYQAGVVSYTNGKVDFMAVLDSLNALRNVRLDYYKARVNYEKAVADLEKAVGRPLFTSGTQP
ncbi:Outer membrane protein TolC [Pelosinus fermentans]|uniref:Outer membrane efflux protein n=1 Tax=Pelosinus fermentans B4 TaxID=1149862 RepID=I9LI18_9FIRM|nr:MULTISPECIES: TolC family protein [Pelosinus]EIW20164.1 outer membrane efflux protein [Pelosinus fermentans B4]OAM93030.1 outer membrane efflux protein [Pelosinus fermentans DSM 17108]SDQ64665.1 Outer membrane protein TolC [Pelosinus fermentans]